MYPPGIKQCIEGVTGPVDWVSIGTSTNVAVTVACTILPALQCVDGAALDAGA